jgi:DNA-binding transcriptional ArsR family regulator
MSRSTTGAGDVEVVFRALAHGARRHILLLLQLRGGEATAGEIAERLSCRWPTTSRHLRVLRSAGLVEVESQGRERVYRLLSERLRRVTGHWLRWFDLELPEQELEELDVAIGAGRPRGESSPAR